MNMDGDFWGKGIIQNNAFTIFAKNPFMLFNQNSNRQIKRWLIKTGFLLFSAIVLFLSFNRHSKSGQFNYHSEIWADKAGYYVYLPALFNYNFDAAAFPDSIAAKTGDGFQLDSAHNKIITKYSSGVAMLQMPFYLAAEIIDLTTQNNEIPGFSKTHHAAINIAAVFYFLLGFLFLGKYLEKRFQNKLVWLVVFLLFTATNLYYYTVDESGMSHVYSFFLFCTFLLLLQKTSYLDHPGIGQLLLTGAVAGLIILIRPTGVLFIATALLLELKHIRDVKIRIKKLLNFNNAAWCIAGMVLIFIPQWLYLQHTFGSPFHYSYGNEGFIWSDPQIIKTLFSTNNGLFTYSPFYFIILIASVYAAYHNIADGRILLFLFAIITYVFASWWMWYYGCSFGGRSFIEYLAIFSIPLAALVLKIHQSGIVAKLGFYMIVSVLLVMNILMTYSWDGCYYGNGDWDWDKWISTVMSKLH